MMIMLGLANEVRGWNLQPRTCGNDAVCFKYRQLEKTTGVPYKWTGHNWVIE